MGKETNIEWCDSTVNPTGFQCCGCELWNPKKKIKICYSGRFQERIAGIGSFDKPVQLMPGRMAQAARWSDLRGKPRQDKPWLDGRPRVIFLGDMADVLQPAVPFEYLKTEIVDVVTSDAGRRHIWMLLTKQSARLVQFQRWLANEHHLAWPDNLWPGVSVTSESKTYRVNDLIKIQSEFRFVSYEPAFDFVDFCRWTSQSEITEDGKGFCPSYKLRMIIMGGCSGPDPAPFHLQWAHDTRDTCEIDHVDFFLKQVGSNPFLTDFIRFTTKHKKGGDWSEWPINLRVRQFPEL